MSCSLTVLMTVHNGGDYLRTAIDSILVQTYCDFQFIIIDDASTDNSAEIITSYQDDRIQLICLQENVGQTAALNIGLGHVTTPWVARMDADDYSAPNRFEEQMRVLDRDQSLACVGTFAWMFRTDPESVDGVISNPLGHEEIKQVILGTPLVHGSIIISKEAISDIRGYDERYSISQDVDLFDRLLEHYRAANVPKLLLGIRQHSNQASRSLKALNENVELSSRRLEFTRYTCSQRKLVRGNLALAYFARGRHHIGTGNPFFMIRDILKGVKASPRNTLQNAVRVFGIELAPTSWRTALRNILGKNSHQVSPYTLPKQTGEQLRSERTIRTKIAIVQPVMIPGGGTEAVTAWTIEALKKDWEVTLLTFSNINALTLNQYYGTNLGEHDFEIIIPPKVPILFKTNRCLMLKDHLMMRYCKSERRKFDLFIGAGGSPMDFGKRGMQFIHLGPDSTVVKVLRKDQRLSRGFLFAKRAFTRFCKVISGWSDEALENNLSMPNSEHTAAVAMQTYGIQHYKVMYPPVGQPQTTTSWASREDGCLCIARIVPPKRIHEVIEIIRRVREKGFNLSLKLVGRSDDDYYFGQIKKLQNQHSSWISMDGGLTREQLVSLMDRYKYGINGALDEHFGIAVAELVKAGTIVFVPNGGGQTEIVGMPELIYDNVDDAVRKISSILSDDQAQQAALDRLYEQSKIFSTDTFCNNMQQTVRDFLQSAAVPSRD